jgi:cbb3-type cytochrome oxidase maturation protein
MNVILATIFVSLVFVAAAVIAFSWSLRQGDHEHGDRLALLPMQDDVSEKE